MAVDITLLFKASVKTVKTRNKALGVPLGGSDSPRDDVLLLKRGSSSRPKSDFSGRAREVVNNIGKLKDFLLQHRKDYINAYSHVLSEYMRMTDTERDQIDQDAQIFMRTCAEAIQQLRTEAHKDIHSPQVKQHREAVLDFIEDYLKRVCKLYSEQRAIRVKRVVDKKRLSRLEPEQSNKSKVTSSPERTAQTSSEESEEKLICEENKDTNMIDEHTNFGLWGDGRGEDELSPEEIQMFEQENQRLVSEMNSLFDEVRQIEGKVVEISRLQEIFTEKVLQQETEIDNIHQLVVGTTENIKEGNEDIRESQVKEFLNSGKSTDTNAFWWKLPFSPTLFYKCFKKLQNCSGGYVCIGNVINTSLPALPMKYAEIYNMAFFSLFGQNKAIKNNAGFRVWILFFLVMCSFSLLFLDWYGS